MRINLELGFKTWTYLLVLSVKFFYVSYIISFMKIAGPLQTVNKCKAEKNFFMKDADVDVVVRSIRDASGAYLRQTLTEGRVDVVEAVEEVPPPRQFLRSLPEKRWREEEKQLIISVLDHAPPKLTLTQAQCVLTFPV